MMRSCRRVVGNMSISIWYISCVSLLRSRCIIWYIILILLLLVIYTGIILMIRKLLCHGLRYKENFSLRLQTVRCLMGWVCIHWSCFLVALGIIKHKTHRINSLLHIQNPEIKPNGMNLHISKISYWTRVCRGTKYRISRSVAREVYIITSIERCEAI